MTGSQPPNWRTGIINSNSRSATSSHIGGVNVAFVDGHIQFITNSIDFATYMRMGTRNGGEVVNQP